MAMTHTLAAKNLGNVFGFGVVISATYPEVARVLVRHKAEFGKVLRDKLIEHKGDLNTVTIGELVEELSRRVGE